jgi:mannitol-1-phosphate 5-dehydrogenase
LCEKFGISTKHIEYICGAAYCYDYPKDPAAIKLQEIIKNKGIKAAIKEISGVDPSSKLGKGIINSYRDLQNKRVKWNQ